MSDFTSVTKEYLDPAVKVDWCVQYVNDMGVTAHTAKELFENPDRVFKQIQKAGLELFNEKPHFGKHSIEFCRKTISTAGTAPT